MSDKINNIKKDFLLKNLKNSIHIKLLDKVSKSPIFISKKTGFVYHPDILFSKKAVERWSKQYKFK